MSSSIRTPSKKSLARVPSLGSSFTSCFGATGSISPPHAGGSGLLAGQAGVSYRKLGFDEDEDEDEGEYIKAPDQEEGASEDEHENVFEERQGPHLKLGSHATSKERAKQGLQFAPQEGDEYARERKGVLKLGKQWTMREKSRMWMVYASETRNKGGYHASEEGGDRYARERKDNESSSERKGGMQLHKQCNMREKSRTEACYASEAPKRGEYITASEEEADEYARERKGGKQCSMRVKEEMGVYDAGSPRRGSLCRKASFGAKVREACVQVLETAKRSSPHLSELFVGNQLLMQVTSSSFSARHVKNMAPSAGFLATGDPSLSVTSPPSTSTSSAF